MDWDDKVVPAERSSANGLRGNQAENGRKRGPGRKMAENGRKRSQGKKWQRRPPLVSARVSRQSNTTVKIS